MTGITNKNIADSLLEKFGAKILSFSEPSGLLTLTIHKDDNLDVISFLMNDPAFEFIFLTDLCGIHYPEQKGGELGVIYHLHSLRHNIRVRIKTFVDAGLPELNSITSLFHAANWMERETYDFYGIRFAGHPGLKRILNMDEMDYFPLQKQYPLEDGKREDKEDLYFGR
jgi:NADH-quinone oxidoreductase subunit C